jgi:hypothetical protein
LDRIRLTVAPLVLASNTIFFKIFYFDPEYLKGVSSFQLLDAKIPVNSLNPWEHGPSRPLIRRLFSKTFGKGLDDDLRITLTYFITEYILRQHIGRNAFRYKLTSQEEGKSF